MLRMTLEYSKELLKPVKYEVFSHFRSVKLELVLPWNDSRFFLSLFSTTVLFPLGSFFTILGSIFFIIVFFIRCDQVPFSDHFTRPRPRTHCSKDDQQCKNVLVRSNSKPRTWLIFSLIVTFMLKSCS